MNTINEDDKIIDISFNQDNSCFAIATENGFKIYQTYPFKGPVERIMGGGIGKIQMLYKSNFLALLGGGTIPKFNNNKVVIWDDYERKVISEIKFITPILNIKFNKDYLFVVCQKRIYIFDNKTYEIIETINTRDNNKGLIAINSDPDSTIIAYPDKEINKDKEKEVNKITIKNFNLKKDSETKITQHESVSFMTLNKQGTLLATSNEKRTIISIHSCMDGSLLKEFKRGREKVDDIYICFDNDNNFLAVGSNKGTIHIFSLKSTFQKLDENIKKKNMKNEKENKEVQKDEKENNKSTKDEKEKNEKKNNEKEKNEKENNKKENNKNEIIDKENEEKEEEKEDIKIAKDKQDKEEGKDDMINIDDKKVEEKSEEKEKNKNIINENIEKKEDIILPENSKTLFGSKEKGFAKVKIGTKIKNVFTFAGNNLLIVISFDNKYYQAEIDVKKGGLCKITEKKI